MKPSALKFLAMGVFGLLLGFIANQVDFRRVLDALTETQTKYQGGYNDYISNNSTRSIAVAPLRRDGVVILITDGAKGFAREAALELSEGAYGYHVLVGVRSEAELKSFTYEARKGLEPILFDISDPTTLVTLIYRLRYLRANMGRDLGGIIINLADFIVDHRRDNGGPEALVNTDIMDSHYRALLKGPTRLLEVFFLALLLFGFFRDCY